VERGGHAVALAGKQQLALLALLLFHANQPLSADRLVEELWGEPTPPRALKRLQLAITRLRQALGGPELDTLTNGYLLRVEPSGLDAEVFQGVLKTTIRNPGERTPAPN